MAEISAAIKLCTICGKEPRVGKSSFCIDCRRTYNREWNQIRRGVVKPRPRPWRALADNEKYCGGCDRILDRSQFYKSVHKKDDLMSHCKRCDCFKQMRYKAKNKVAHREKNRISQAKFRATHPGYNSAAVQRYRRRRIQRKLEAALYGKR